MRSLRWWHAAVLGIAALLAVLIIVDPRGTLWVSLAIVAAFVLAWFALARRAFDCSPAAVAALSVVVVLLAGLGAALNPSFATFQCLAFPLLWSIVDRLRTVIVANLALAVSVGIGLSLSLDPLAALAIEVTSLVFSFALGLWITSIANTSEERQRLLDELRAAQEKLSALDRDAGVASERERFAREIHDTIAQDLTGLVMLTQRAQRELGDSPSGTLALLEQSARHALSETRGLVAATAPLTLTGGLADALRRLGERFQRETGVTVTVSVDALPALERDAEVVLLRSAQEGLGNVRKHSGATSATITARAEGDTVAVVVTDDGSGFDVERARDGFGLSGLRDRLQLVAGSLEVESSPAGTTVTARLPIGARR
jgi:signal transduction histidine kinase